MFDNQEAVDFVKLNLNTTYSPKSQANCNNNNELMSDVELVNALPPKPVDTTLHVTQQLVNEAIKLGSMDNVSVIIIFFHHYSKEHKG